MQRYSSELSVHQLTTGTVQESCRPLPSSFSREVTLLSDSFGEQTTLSLETQEASSHQPSPQKENLEPPRKQASLSRGEMLEEKEAEVVRLQDEVGGGP